MNKSYINIIISVEINKILIYNQLISLTYKQEVQYGFEQY